MAKAYNAGTIFLQVVPVFRETIKEIRDHAKDIDSALGDQMEESGRKAGKRAGKALGEEMAKEADESGKEYAGAFNKSLKDGLKRTSKELGAIKVEVDHAGLASDLETIKRQLNTLSDAKVGVDIDAKEAYGELKLIEKRLEALQRDALELNVRVDTDEARKGLQSFVRRVEAASPELKVDLDTTPATKAMGAFETKLRKSAERAGKSMSKELKGRAGEIRIELERLGNVDITPDLDAKQVRSEIAGLSAELRAMALDSIDFEVKADTGAAYMEMLAINKEATALDGKHVEITADLNSRNAMREMGAFENKVRDIAKKAGKSIGGDLDGEIKQLRKNLTDLGNQDITPELDSERVIAEMRATAAKLRAIATAKDIKPEVKIDASTAYAQLVPLMKIFSAIDGKKLNVNVDLDAGGAIVKAGLLASALGMAGAAGNKAGMGAENAANSFRSFNAVVLAAVALIPALIPMIASLGGALLALIPIFGAVGAGLGAMLVGFSGIGNAVGAMNDLDKNAAKDAQAAADKMRGAARAVADAERGLANARRSAAQANADAARNVARAQEEASRSIQDALRRQRDAERDLADAQRDARDAQRELTEARREAREEMEQLADDSARNALDERQAVIDLFNAQVEWNATRADGGSTNLELEQTDINLERARLSLKEIRDEEEALQKQKKEGVGGTAAVQSAEDQLTAALERQRDAQRAVGDAAREVREARIAGARSVADAIRQQNRTEADGARAVADAQRTLRRAQEDYARALHETAVVGSESMQKYQEAMDALGPAGRKFARFIFGLKGEAYALRDAVQSAMLPGVQRGLQTIIKTYGPQFRDFAARMGGVVGRLFESAGKGLGRQPWDEFFATYSKLAPRLLEQFGKTTGNWMGVYAKLFTIIAPYAERLSLALLDLSENALKWMQSGKGENTFTKFMDYVMRVGPDVWEFIKSLGRVIIAVMEALAPWGEVVMKALTGLFNWIAGLDRKLLGTILSTIIALVIAFQVAVGVVAMVVGGMLIAQVPLAAFMFGLMAVVGILVVLYTQSETARNIIKGFAAQIWGARKPLLFIGGALLAVFAGLKLFALGVKLVGIAMRLTPLGMIVVAIGLIVAGLVWAYNKFDWFRKVIDGIIDFIMGIFFGLWDYLFGNSIMPDIVDGMKWAVDMIGKVLGGIWKILKWVGKAFMWLWKNAVKPALKLIWAYWKFVFKVMKGIWNNILRPVLDLIFTLIKLLWSKIVKPVLKLIWDFWKRVFRGMKVIWENILKPVLDLIFTIIKKLWEKIFKPILGFIQRRWETLMRNMKWVWQNVLKPVFDFITDTILPKLKNAFDWVVDKIKSAWDKLKNIAKKPVKFVVETVINKGLIAGFNKVAGWVGSDKMDPIKLPEGFARGGIPSARNVDVYPGYSPGRDTGYIGIGGGEAIMRPEWTKMMGADYVRAANAAARRGMGALQKFMGGYAKGGVIDFGGNFAKGGVWHPGPRSQRAGHGKSLDQAWDINSAGGTGTPVRAFLEGVITTVANLGNTSYGQYIKMNHPAHNLQSLYAHLSRMLVRPGQKVERGQIIGREGSTGGSTGPHLHFELGGGASAISAFAGVGTTGSAASLPGWLERLIGDAAGWFKGKISDGLDALKDRFGGGALVDFLTEVPLKMIDGLVDKVMSMVGGGKNGDVDISGISGPVRDQVQKVAAQYGWGSGAQWNAILELVQRESSWNPNAANPDSSARGLFQKMTSIHGPVEKTAAGQAQWGLRYIFGRYGTPVNALREHTAKGWYADGGVVPEEGSSTSGLADNGTMMYDRGGYLPPGLTQVVNMTGKPEPVFTADQFENMQRGGGSGIHYEPHFTESDLTSEDVSEDLLFTLKSIERTGKYGRG